MIALLPNGSDEDENRVETTIRFHVIFPSTITEEERIIGKRRKKKHREETYQTNFRFTLEEFEYIARLAKNDIIHNSRKRIINAKIFGRSWKEELANLRDQQRRLRYPDTDFYPNAVKKKVGVKVKMGRRPKYVRRVA